MIQALKLRLAVVLILLHVGMAFAIVGLWQTATLAPAAPLNWLIAGVACLYGSFLVTALFIMIPAWPWIQRARRLREWQTWAFEILPQIMAIVPLVLTVFNILKQAWAHFEKTGDLSSLDPEKLGKKIRAKTKAQEKDSDEE